MAEANPIVSVQTTAGTIKLELFEDAAPNTVANFISLAEKGYYDNKKFHRIIKDFMIQGGCPNGNGMGGPGYRIKDELKGNTNKHNHYALSMAKTAAPDSGGSQFFIVTSKRGTPHLDGVHTVFGKVIEGQAVVDALGNCTTDGSDRPTPEQKIVSVTVVSKRAHPYAVKTL